MTKTAVLIDDDQDDLEFLHEAIKNVDDDMIVKRYLFCDEAIQEIITLPIAPHYIFIDINMPKIRGDDCLKQLRSNPKFEKSTITMFSTSMPKNVSQKLKNLGADFTFEKPIKFETYYAILKAIL